MGYKITYKSFGTQAILIQWKAIIDEEILKDILLFKEKITLKRKDDFTDLVVGYTSLTIKYKAEFIDFSQEVEALKLIYKIESFKSKQDNYIWKIPVCYEAQFGIDLEEISSNSILSTQEIINLHSQKIYTVFFIGFLPGFLYLGGLDALLFFNRKPNPRLNVAKGSIAIGGNQTGIYPSESAGGWNIIGKTPINFFEVKSDTPCFAKAGDKIKFNPIPLEEFYKLEEKVIKKKYTISKIKWND